MLSWIAAFQINLMILFQFQHNSNLDPRNLDTYLCITQCWVSSRWLSTVPTRPPPSHHTVASPTGSVTHVTHVHHSQWSSQLSTSVTQNMSPRVATSTFHQISNMHLCRGSPWWWRRCSATPAPRPAGPTPRRRWTWAGRWVCSCAAWRPSPGSPPPSAGTTPSPPPPARTGTRPRSSEPASLSSKMWGRIFARILFRTNIFHMSVMVLSLSLFVSII